MKSLAGEREKLGFAWQEIHDGHAVFSGWARPIPRCKLASLPFSLTKPCSVRFKLNALIDPVNSLFRSVQSFHDVNSSPAVAYLFLPHSHLSSIQFSNVSSLSRYSRVASSTAFGRRRPLAAHLLVPLIIQDTWPFGFEFFGEHWIAIGLWDGYGEWDEMESAAHGFVDIAQAGLVISGDEQLELWGELEKVLAHPATSVGCCGLFVIVKVSAFAVLQ
jgi:hypothetical protein